VTLGERNEVHLQSNAEPQQGARLTSSGGHSFDAATMQKIRETTDIRPTQWLTAESWLLKRTGAGATTCRGRQQMERRERTRVGVSDARGRDEIDACWREAALSSSEA
jgi:hypothetical protein